MSWPWSQGIISVGRRDGRRCGLTFVPWPLSRRHCPIATHYCLQPAIDGAPSQLLQTLQSIRWLKITLRRWCAGFPINSRVYRSNVKTHLTCFPTRLVKICSHRTVSHRKKRISNARHCPKHLMHVCALDANTRDAKWRISHYKTIYISI